MNAAYYELYNETISKVMSIVLYINTSLNELLQARQHCATFRLHLLIPKDRIPDA